ncbi:hypothetical protein [Chthoniobacter flavus]|uniref:hypothetical protein n=1 Tax=Chthoniobacter flavus TaxID=191863 RepID=UPI0005B28B14|nr:hypothetical protein [Chthoniobacter flavus]
MNLLTPSIIAACLSGTVHGQTLSALSTQVFQEFAQPILAAIPGPLSIPLGVIGGIGALLLLRPRRRRR